MSRSRREGHVYPPKLGEDTADVLRAALGADEGEIARLMESGAVRGHTPKTAKKAEG